MAWCVCVCVCRTCKCVCRTCECVRVQRTHVVNTTCCSIQKIMPLKGDSLIYSVGQSHILMCDKH